VTAAQQFATDGRAGLDVAPTSVPDHHNSHQPNLTRKADAPQVGRLFQEISRARGTLGGCGHLGGELAGLRGAFRRENEAQVRDQRVQGAGRKGAPKTDFQLGDGSRPDRLVVDPLGRGGSDPKATAVSPADSTNPSMLGGTAMHTS